MKHQTARAAFSCIYGTLSPASLLLLLLPVTTHAQGELHADKQILLETARGTMALRKGPEDALFVLTRSVTPPSSLWKSDYTGSSMRQILGGGSEPTELRFPKDLAVDHDGNAIVVDAGSIKIFSSDGRLINSFPFNRPESVGVLSDGRILVSGIGLPQEHLVYVFDHRGRLLGNIGKPAKVEDVPGPGSNAILNIGSIVVDDDDNIYYIFRFLFTPTVRKYTSDGKLVAEWHPESAYLDQAVVRARAKYEEHKEQGFHGGSPLLTAGAFDSEKNTFWVASGHHLLQLDSSGKTIRSFELLQPDGVPLQAQGLLVDQNFIRAAGELHGTFEFFKPH